MKIYKVYSLYEIMLYVEARDEAEAMENAKLRGLIGEPMCAVEQQEEEN